MPVIAHQIRREPVSLLELNQCATHIAVLMLHQLREMPVIRYIIPRRSGRCYHIHVAVHVLCEPIEYPVLNGRGVQQVAAGAVRTGEILASQRMGVRGATTVVLQLARACIETGHGGQTVVPFLCNNI